ncbi:MAG: DUF411 domain-containing protein [Burkholderiales bacterium]|nr:DUF411 domain-containing protein [Burkholderiales bacterium]
MPAISTKRRLLASLLVGAAWVAAPVAFADETPVVEVWKGPQCVCCRDWIKHIEANGFRVKTHDTGNTSIRKQLGIPTELGSCHTARVGRYAIEGHVPAREITRLIKEKPAALGLAVPRMPLGSPGMDGPAYGNKRDPYDVLLVTPEGKTTVYQSYR